MTINGEKEHHVTGYSLFDIPQGNDDNPSDFDVILVHQVFIVIFVYEPGDIYVYNVENNNVYKAEKKLDLSGYKFDLVNYDGYQYFYFFLNYQDEHIMIDRYDVLPKIPECFPIRTVDGYLRIMKDILCLNQFVILL